MTMARRSVLVASVGIAALTAMPAMPAIARRTVTAAPPTPPEGYQLIGARTGVPALVLYGVALQESARVFGASVLPYPWTLCVQGKGLRYSDRDSAIDAMHRFIASGVTNIDTCLMQVNWGYHKHLLQTPELALDPYPNMAIGAHILKQRFKETPQWYTAVGRYHSPANADRAKRYADSVFARLAQIDQGGSYG
jgi:hypothetical protein